MLQHGAPILYAVFLWWFSTGLILLIIGLPRRTHGWSLGGATVLAALGLAAFFLSAHDTSVLGAYVAFTSALLVWGWHEIAFLTGFVTGPRRDRATPDSAGWPRFREAFGTVAHHEIAILLTALLLAVMVWNAPNAVGFWTFVVLWVMRISAKLNVFWGVPNINEEFLPRQLDFLTSYFRKGPTNGFFPVAVSLATIGAGALLVHGFVLELGPLWTAGLMLVGSLLTLAVIEHWFMVLPLKDAALWRWALRGAHVAALDGDAPLRADDRQSWRTSLVGAYDPAGLETVLQDVARGTFGRIAEVRGVARACSGWVRFDLVGGQPHLISCQPTPQDEAAVVAEGWALDGLRLQAAFDGCLTGRAA
ncbi:MAG: putative photosynthetic complex assembly protein PuhE [Pseudomonadota bacterium]